VHSQITLVHTITYTPIKAFMVVILLRQLEEVTKTVITVLLQLLWLVS